jgi:hypothetical protein
MAGNFMTYGAREATFGSKNVGDIPVESPELIALCAPRLVFVSYETSQSQSTYFEIIPIVPSHVSTN